MGQFGDLSGKGGDVTLRDMGEDGGVPVFAAALGVVADDDIAGEGRLDRGKAEAFEFGEGHEDPRLAQEGGHVIFRQAFDRPPFPAGRQMGGGEEAQQFGMARHLAGDIGDPVPFWRDGAEAICGHGDMEAAAERGSLGIGEADAVERVIRHAPDGAGAGIGAGQFGGIALADEIARLHEDDIGHAQRGKLQGIFPHPEFGKDDDILRGIEAALRDAREAGFRAQCRAEACLAIADPGREPRNPEGGAVGMADEGAAAFRREHVIGESGQLVDDLDPADGPVLGSAEKDEVHGVITGVRAGRAPVTLLRRVASGLPRSCGPTCARSSVARRAARGVAGLPQSARSGGGAA